MENRSRIEELLAEVLIKQDEFRQELKDVGTEVSALKSEMSAVKNEVFGVKHEVSSVKQEVASVKQEVASVKQEMIKLNLLTAENTRAIMKMSDAIVSVFDHERRLSKVEQTLFK